MQKLLKKLINILNVILTKDNKLYNQVGQGYKYYLPGGVTYIDSDGSKKRPIMLHRVIFGSVERFIGILIEHYAGAFPLWLSPTQINIVPVNNLYHLEYSKEIMEKLKENNIRVELDDREEKLGYKLRESVIKKIPYTLIIGQKETDENKISYRKYGTEETVTVTLEEFINKLKLEIENKSN